MFSHGLLVTRTNAGGYLGPDRGILRNLVGVQTWEELRHRAQPTATHPAGATRSGQPAYTSGAARSRSWCQRSTRPGNSVSRKAKKFPMS